MPIYSSIFINQSVGRNAKNADSDVRTIQARLNELSNAPRIPLVVDGACGAKTRNALRDFQISVCAFRNPDSRVDPAGKTITALNDPASEGIWGKMSIPPQPQEPKSCTDPSLDDPVMLRSRDEIIDAAIAEIEKNRKLSPFDRQNLRRLLAEVWEGQKPQDKYIPVSGIPANQAVKVIKNLKLAADVSRVLFLAGSGFFSGSVIATVGAAWSGLCVLLMPVGFAFALNHALTAHRRVYAAVAQAYWLAHWVHGGKSYGSSAAFFTGPRTPHDMQQMSIAWTDAQSRIRAAMSLTVQELATKAGVSPEEAKVGLKVLMSASSPDEICRQVYRMFADKERDKHWLWGGSDMQFAIKMDAFADSRLPAYGR